MNCKTTTGCKWTFFLLLLLRHLSRMHLTAISSVMNIHINTISTCSALNFWICRSDSHSLSHSVPCECLVYLSYYIASSSFRFPQTCFMLPTLLILLLKHYFIIISWYLVNQVLNTHRLRLQTQWKPQLTFVQRNFLCKPVKWCQIIWTTHGFGLL